MLDNDITKEKRFTSSVCEPKTATSVSMRHFPECSVNVDIFVFWLQWLRQKKVLSCRNSRPPFFFFLTACMLLLAGLQCSWVGLLCLKQQRVHRLTLQDGGFPVAVSEAWKAEMLLVKILWYPSHLTFRRTFHEVYGWWSTSCLTWKLSKILYNLGLTELSTNWRWHQGRTRWYCMSHWTAGYRAFFVVTCAKK